jgi:hypothetical protein
VTVVHVAAEVHLEPGTCTRCGIRWRPRDPPVVYLLTETLPGFPARPLGRAPRTYRRFGRDERCRPSRRSVRVRNPGVRLHVAERSPQRFNNPAPWGERYFHIQDRDGHELSFARPLARR